MVIINIVIRDPEFLEPLVDNPYLDRDISNNSFKMNS